MRRAVGVAPESVNSILSRWGSQQLYNINAISLYRFNGKRYQYDGRNLFQNGTVIKTGGNGSKLTFVTMPPQPGQQDYLFVLGGGWGPFKISPAGTMSSWGIQPPPDRMQVLPGTPDSLVIDTFVSSHSNWTGTNATTADNTTIPPFAASASCLGIAPSNTQAETWYATRSYLSAQNLAYYGDGKPSLLTDLISFWVWMTDPTKFLYLSIQFDVNDGSFTDYYVANIQFVPGATDPRLTGGIAQVVQADGGRWTQVAIAKSQFTRIGTMLNLDWNTVMAIRFQGGLPYGGVGVMLMGLQNLEMTGGDALGTGSAAATGGSVYLYQVTFGNETTGSDSNPNLQPAIANGVAEGPNMLKHIPVSPDPQVGNRKLWRSSALPLGSVSGPLFFLDIIHDNTTTTYTDIFGDIATPYTSTLWVATSTYIAGQLIDGGNGWLFNCSTPGTTGAAQPPWNAPGGYWIPLESNFTVGDTIYDVASGFVLECTKAGLTSNVVPNFGRLAVGGTLTDGTVTWTRIAAPTTADGTVVWTFQGINSPPILGNVQVYLDNAAPDPTVGDAAGPWQNSMVWSRCGNFPGDVFISPPGRPESFGGQQLHVSSTDDPAQKVVVWDVFLWLLSTKKPYQIAGTYPAIAPLDNDADGGGTILPYTVVSVSRVGVFYNSTDGIRLLNNSGSVLVGFQNIAPLLRGQTEEGIPAFNPTWAAQGRYEVYFGDGTTTLALSYAGGDLIITTTSYMWREIGLPMLAAYYERDTGDVQASWGGNVLLYEQEGNQNDGGSAIPLLIQSPGDLPDAAVAFQTQRLYLTAQLNGQTLIPVMIVDGTSYTLPELVGTARKTFELPKQISGRLFDGVQLIGSLTNRIEIFRIEADVWLGNQ
jgi:hypothetical protein